VPHALIDEVARDEAVALVAPVIETRVRLGREASAARLIGIDLFSAAALMPALLPREGGGDCRRDIRWRPVCVGIDARRPGLESRR
jgi:hypothetical protein